MVGMEAVDMLNEMQSGIDAVLGVIESDGTFSGCRGRIAVPETKLRSEERMRRLDCIVEGG